MQFNILIFRNNYSKLKLMWYFAFYITWSLFHSCFILFWFVWFWRVGFINSGIIWQKYIYILVLCSYRQIWKCFIHKRFLPFYGCNHFHALRLFLTFYYIFLLFCWFVRTTCFVFIWFNFSDLFYFLFIFRKKQLKCIILVSYFFFGISLSANHCSYCIDIRFTDILWIMLHILEIYLRENDWMIFYDCICLRSFFEFNLDGTKILTRTAISIAIYIFMGLNQSYYK